MFDLAPHTILLVVAGSRSMGFHRPESDVDLKGIAIPPMRYFHGVFHRFEQSEDVGRFEKLLNAEERAAVTQTRLEGTVYDIRKYISLAADCNPTILETLFCRDDEIRLVTAPGRRLRAARHVFLSAQARHTYAGYAASQLKRIRGHRAWLLDPPTRPPTRAEFGLPENTLLPRDQLNAAEAAIRKQIERWDFDRSGLSSAALIALQGQIAENLAAIRVALGLEGEGTAEWLAAARVVGLDSNLILVMQREREYDAAARHWKQYSTWKENRNAARAALEANSGYDTKHAAHLIRLLRMGREILETGQVHVWRGQGSVPTDAEELRAIRDGSLTYDQMMELAEGEERRMQQVWDEGRAVVPKESSREAIEALCIEVVESALELRT